MNVALPSRTRRLAAGAVLVALPVAAVANVLLRYVQEQYTASKLYAGDAPAILLDAHAPLPAEPRDAV